MTVSRGAPAGTYTSWFSSVSQCCVPLTSCLSQRSGRNDQDHSNIREKQTPPPVIRHQPRMHHQPPLELGYEEAYSRLHGQREKAPRKSSASSRTAFSVRKRFRSDASSRRPLISAPTDFRHVRSGSFQFPAPVPQDHNPQARPNPPRRRHSIERLELSIYMPENQISPLLPHFQFPIPPIPPTAHLQRRATDVSSIEQSHERNYSSMSFHVPRKAGAEGSGSTMQDDIPPLIPPKAKARARAYTSPEVDVIKERVASAMIEVERLQKQIDDVIERQSLHAPSRPSTAHSMARTMPDLEEPMPSIPALPPAAPSFAERLKDDTDRPDRPHTAPIKTPLRIPPRSKAFNEASATFNTPISASSNHIPLPPPLPLVLRPPLRKKKSFSRVSNWLSMSQGHNRDLSLESITNHPRPVKGTDGFYQCVPAGQSASDRRSFGSVGSISTWDTDEEERTVPTTWSPGSTPITKTDAPSADRSMTFGRFTGITVQRSFGITA
ncbi:hypothetical protein NLU13_4905 [Sarocladium strictum]|uniref:Uncharacterized protein n=1 Tax=Sarocladium strictum TaxID=5046 RepID=A0AA39GME2_SARSR|nr:hypothetical protein NLU13_4905 [Sarocladium strictum]